MDISVKIVDIFDEKIASPYCTVCLKMVTETLQPRTQTKSGVIKMTKITELKVPPVGKMVKNIHIKKNLYNFCCFVAFYVFSDHTLLRTFLA